ncbi:inositol monophosphatase [Tessaracoccus sp. OS52]|uniref:inositol monophosphatase family protein n=1 Tax=Tessaracoccus sp. OS52 TaxID=2886691 RepID=UPI001D11F360|nr:inositol monophosphatase family protein [Tessaracoccus sp. OS52]MCC2591817.1 inositol monophosphatase [Tessaracoccus sp. OS52]
MEWLYPGPELLAELGDVAVGVAHSCGRLIVDERPSLVEVAGTKSSTVDVVTVMDRRSESLARDILAGARCEDGLLGEEGLDRSGSSGLTWVIDPIDATVNYLYDVPGYAVSVAAVIGDPRVEGGWRPVAGAVFNPVLDEMFSAQLGRGAQLDSPRGRTRLEPRPALALEHSLVATGFGYDASQRAWQGRAVAELLPRVRDIRRSGCASLDLCAVALGRVDAYYETGLNPWDFAAGWLVASESGLCVRGLGTQHPSGRLTVAGRTEICEELAQLTSRHLPAD